MYTLIFLIVNKGMSLYQVIQILKSNCETIKTVQLVYNDKVINKKDEKLSFLAILLFYIFNEGSYKL